MQAPVQDKVVEAKKIIKLRGFGYPIRRKWPARWIIFSVKQTMKDFG